MVGERSVVIRLKGDISDFRTKMAQAGQAAKVGLGKELDAIGKRNQAFDQIGRSAGRVGLIAAAGFGIAVAAAANFDQAMSNVAASGADAAANLEGLRQVALKAGADTAFSASQAAAGVENLAKAGISAKDIIGGALGGALDLAAAGTIDVASAAEYVATALTQFSLAGQDATHVADLLAAGAGKAQGEVTDMAEALNYVGVPAANLGISIEEAAGSIALLASNGILGSQAGTSLRGVLASLTSPSRIAAEEMKKLRISVFDAQGEFIGFEGVAGQLQDRLSTLTEKERANALGRIFGNEQLQAANILYRDGARGVREWTNAVDDEGYAFIAAKTRLNNLKGDFEQLTGSIENLLITTGEGGQGPLRSLTQSLTDTVNVLNKAPDAAKQTALAFGLITAVVGGGLFFSAKVLVGIVSTRAALDAVAVSGTRAAVALRLVTSSVPWLLGLSAAAAVILALRDAMKASVPTAQDFVEQLVELKTSGTGKLSEDLADVADALSQVGEAGDSLKVVSKYAGELTSATASLGGAKDDVDAFDKALKSVVDTAGASAGENLFTYFAEQAGYTADETNRAREQLPLFTKALKDSATAADLASVATSGLTVAQQESADASAAQADALRESRDEARGTAEEFVGLGDDVDNAKVSLDDWIQSIYDQADALREFRINARKAQKRGLDDAVIAALQDRGPEGAMRLEQLAALQLGPNGEIPKQIQDLNDAWAGAQTQVEKYTDAVGGTAPTITVKVEGLDDAIKKTNFLRGLLGMPGVPGDLYLTATQAAPRTGRLGEFAEGGYTGNGSKYQPAGVVHAGEFVFSAAATRGNLAYLTGLHNQLKGYASGGFVAASRPAPAYQAADVAAVMAAASASRPTVQYGDVHVQPHDYSEFVRQQRQDLARASTGGLRR